MRLAVMQPYFFPYIGYFQLINAVDKFVFYDDVNFIKGGWINRNRIIINDKPKFLTVPIAKVSSFRKTCDTEIKRNQYFQWKSKVFKTLEQHYGKRPFYSEVLPIIKVVLEEESESIGELSKKSIIHVLNYLGIKKNIVWSSEIYENSELRREDRILNICQKENAKSYLNLIGGISIYDKAEFKRHEINLEFLRSKPESYNQGNLNFSPQLSIIDVLMNNSKDDIKRMLLNYDLV